MLIQQLLRQATVSFPCFLTHGGHAAVVVVALRTGANAALLDAIQHFCGPGLYLQRFLGLQLLLEVIGFSGQALREINILTYQIQFQYY